MVRDGVTEGTASLRTPMRIGDPEVRARRRSVSGAESGGTRRGSGRKTEAGVDASGDAADGNGADQARADADPGAKKGESGDEKPVKASAFMGMEPRSAVSAVAGQCAVAARSCRSACSKLAGSPGRSLSGNKKASIAGSFQRGRRQAIGGCRTSPSIATRRPLFGPGSR